MTPLPAPIFVKIDCVERAVLLAADFHCQSLHYQHEFYRGMPTHGHRLEKISRSITDDGGGVLKQVAIALAAQGIDWATWEPTAPLTVNGHTVEFQKDSIRVGCTTVSKETVLEIAKRLQEAA